MMGIISVWTLSLLTNLEPCSFVCFFFFKCSDRFVCIKICFIVWVGFFSFLILFRNVCLSEEINLFQHHKLGLHLLIKHCNTRPFFGGEFGC